MAGVLSSRSPRGTSSKMSQTPPCFRTRCIQAKDKTDPIDESHEALQKNYRLKGQRAEQDIGAETSDNLSNRKTFPSNTLLNQSKEQNLGTTEVRQNLHMRSVQTLYNLVLFQSFPSDLYPTIPQRSIALCGV